MRLPDTNIGVNFQRLDFDIASREGGRWMQQGLMSKKSQPRRKAGDETTRQGYDRSYARGRLVFGREHLSIHSYHQV